MCNSGSHFSYWYGYEHDCCCLWMFLALCFCRYWPLSIASHKIDNVLPFYILQTGIEIKYNSIKAMISIWADRNTCSQDKPKWYGTELQPKKNEKESICKSRPRPRINNFLPAQNSVWHSLHLKRKLFLCNRASADRNWLCFASFCSLESIDRLCMRSITLLQPWLGHLNF